MSLRFERAHRGPGHASPDHALRRADLEEAGRLLAERLRLYARIEGGDAG